MTEAMCGGLRHHNDEATGAPSYAVGYSIIEDKIVTSRKPTGVGALRESYAQKVRKTNFNIP
jgi:hypothetical protein